MKAKLLNGKPRPIGGSYVRAVSVERTTEGMLPQGYIVTEKRKRNSAPRYFSGDTNRVCLTGAEIAELFALTQIEEL